MQKNPTSQSGIFSTRVVIAFALCSIGTSLGWLSFASTPSSAPLTFGGPDPTVPGNPRYQNFYAPAGSSAESQVQGEFNIGFDPKSGRIMVMNIGPIWRLTPPELLTPSKPECCEALWEDKSAVSTNTGLDPILWTDQKTGRTFASNSTAGANAVYAYTDAAAPFNDGDQWVPIGVGPPNGGVDHQTIGTGPFPASLSILTTPLNQGEYALYCSQDGVGSVCQRSLDLGMTWGNGVPATGPGTNNSKGCGGLHGHVHIAPNGTAWLPDKSCGSTQGGATSTDASTTPWTEFVVSGNNDVNGGAAFTATSQAVGADPSIGIDSDSVAYYCYVNNENGGGTEGHVHVAVSTDNGLTWIRDVDVGATHGIINAAETEAVGGSAGRAACGFLGTNVSGDYQSGTFTGVWYAFIATTYDQGRTWVTVNATPNDPVQNHTGIWQQGGSGQNGDRNLLDFNEITVDNQGRVLYGYSDGCHSLTCIQGNNSANERGAYMRVARQFGGKPLFSQFDPSPAEPGAPRAPCLSGTRDASGVHLTWKTPDNGGADITNYRIFRGTASGTETFLIQSGDTKTTFNDITVDPSQPAYYYVRAVNSVDVSGGALSNEVNFPATPGIWLLRVSSTKTHGSAGTFGIDLPLDGSAIECRSVGALPGGAAGDYQLVFDFANPLSSVSGASVVAGTGSVSSSSIQGGNYVVNLTGVANAQRLTVTLTGVTDSAGNTVGSVSATMGVLLGDVNASGIVTSGDTNLCKAQALQPVTNANFRNDVNASGAITTGDVNIIKQNALTHLP